MKLMTQVILAALAAASAHASGYVGVYSLIDKVTIEPGADQPERIRIDGVFSFADPGSRGTFQPPQRGYLYFSLPAGTERALALKEWSDLQAAAGTHTVIAFGGSTFAGESHPAPRLRPANQLPSDPDLYVVGAGLSRMRSNTDYGPVKALLEFK